MFVLYAFVCACVLSLLDLIYIKIFQLENYRIKNYLKKVFDFEIAFGKKNKLNFTKRIKRLIIFDFFLNFLYFFLIFFLINNIYLIISLVFFGFIFSEYLIVTTFLIAMPIENAIKINFVKKAKKKLKQTNCKKIAITGSFGKTSTKNILYQILKEEFDVCASPQSYNTPMGICKTILGNLKETDDFLIVEYGARRKGDIKFLAENFGVDFGIVTPIGNCHLETFGSLENIANEKYELCQNARECVLFNGKSLATKNLFDKYPYKKYLVCSQNSFAYAKNIKHSADGSKFDLIVNGQKIQCKSSLMGKANIDNIVVATAMAYLLGESLFSIQKAIEKLRPIPHRLELIKSGFAYVLDDSYNSNLEGFKTALDVLKSFKGKKIVVSPGMIELGLMQAETNFEAGEMVAKVADIFVIMNETNKKSLYDGAVSAGMEKERIYFATTRKEQTNLLKSILTQGDVVLFENDFPDNVK